MKRHDLMKVAMVASAMVFATSAYAEEGAATGNGTSTPAGPAGDNSGPSKSSSSSMKSGGSMMKGDSMTSGGGAATGAGENKPTATGGEPGGGAGKN